MSNYKFAEALKMLNVEPPTKISSATGKESFAFAKTDAGLKALLEHEDPCVQALVAARLEHKTTIEETRSELYLNAASFGPWPLHYNYSGAMQTHRFTGGKGSGGNPQNLPRGSNLRKAICAPEGHALVVGDLSQIECRITLALAGETEALNKLENGEDIYSWFASLMYNVPVNKKNYPLERQVGKSAVLGLGYGMGAQRFKDYCQQQDIILTLEQAKEAVDLYRSVFPGVPRLWKQGEDALKYIMAGKKGFKWPVQKGLWETSSDPLTGAAAIKLNNGLYIRYPHLKYEDSQWTYQGDGTTYKIWGGLVFENCVQATAGIIMMEQLLKINKHISIVMSTHDELVGVVKKEKAVVAEKIIHTMMTTPLDWWPELPLAAEVHSGERYGDIK
jgi:DNA polymerase